MFELKQATARQNQNQGLGQNQVQNLGLAQNQGLG